MFGGTSVPLWRRLAAGAGGITSAIVLLVWVTASSRYKVMPAVAMLFAAAAVVHVPRLGAQVFARAAWWASVGLGELIALLDTGGSDRMQPLFYLVPSAAALLVIGRRGIAEAEEKSGHVASAFRSSLLLLMVLALADAQTFTVFGLIILDGERFLHAAVLFAAAAALAVGFVGLFRLALWGALVNVGACVLVLFATVSGVVRARDTLATAILVLAGVHVLVGAPVVYASITNRRLPSLPARVRGTAVTGAILALVAIAAVKILAGGS